MARPYPPVKLLPYLRSIDASKFRSIKFSNIKLYSQQRRRERYRVIYIWKILEGLVPDPIPSLLLAKFNDRTGRKCAQQALPTQAPQRVKTLLACSLPFNGPKIFNALPRKIRDLTNCSVSKFKMELDNFLQTLTDEPPVTGYTANCRATSNSVPDQMELKKKDSRDGGSGGPPQLWGTPSRWHQE